MRTLLAALLAVSAVPGAAALPASSDDAFVRRLGAIQAGARDAARFQRITQETGPEDPLLRMQQPMISLLRRVTPSVVALKITIPLPPPPPPAPGQPPLPAPPPAIMTCTGSFIDTAGLHRSATLIVTAAHCLENLPAGSSVEAGLYGPDADYPRLVPARVLAVGSSASAKDVALLELADRSLNRTGLPLWDRLDLGEQVVAIGSGRGLHFSVSQGVVSALRREMLGPDYMIDLVQNDAAVNPGNSGGPLFNLWGSVVGVNTAIYSVSGSYEGISLALPAEYVRSAIRQHARTGNLAIGTLQASFDRGTSSNLPRVAAVTPGGPAALARLAVGDEVVSVDGVDLSASRSPGDGRRILVSRIRYMSPGEAVSLVVRRGSRDVSLRITLGSAPVGGSGGATLAPQMTEQPDAALSL